MNNKWLHRETPIYFELNTIYETFSHAEDYPWHILSYLIPYIKDKVLIDFGCGTGKYTHALAWYSKYIYAIDASKDQVWYTQNRTQKYNNISYHTIENWVLPQTNATCVIACRVLWTIKDELQRDTIFTNLINSLQPWCMIYFIENDTTGEFEEIRGKTTDPLQPTLAYNNRLEKKWCTILEHIQTYFQFTSSSQAQSVFSTIRWELIWKKITSSRIEHKVIIYQYVVK